MDFLVASDGVQREDQSSVNCSRKGALMLVRCGEGNRVCKRRPRQCGEPHTENLWVSFAASVAGVDAWASAAGSSCAKADEASRAQTAALSARRMVRVGEDEGKGTC